MINKDSIVTAYDEHLTLVEWLQKVENALNNAVLTNLGIAKLSDKDNVATYQVTATFADNTTIVSDTFTLPSTDIVTAFSNLTALVNGFDTRITQNTADIDNVKSSVNTGTFDPTSNNPAGQKSTADYNDAVLGDEIIRNGIVETYLYSSNKGNNIFAPRNVFQGIHNMCSGRFGKDRYGNNPFFSVAWDIGGWRLNFDRTFCYAQITYFDFNNTIQYLMDNGAFSAVDTFKGGFALEEIASYDFKNCSNMSGFFGSCGSLRHIHIKNFPVSFDISASTLFEESDLVEILNNLMDLTGKTSQTLTMGATNLAKLTDTEKAIATNKNWTLA